VLGLGLTVSILRIKIRLVYVKTDKIGKIKCYNNCWQYEPIIYPIPWLFYNLTKQLKKKKKKKKESFVRFFDNNDFVAQVTLIRCHIGKRKYDIQ